MNVDNNQRRALGDVLRIRHVVEELRELLTAATAAEIQAIHGPRGGLGNEESV